MFNVVAAILLVYTVQSERDEITRVLSCLFKTSRNDNAFYTHNVASSSCNCHRYGRNNDVTAPMHLWFTWYSCGLLVDKCIIVQHGQTFMRFAARVPSTRLRRLCRQGSWFLCSWSRGRAPKGGSNPPRSNHPGQNLPFSSVVGLNPRGKYPLGQKWGVST